jgi:hypothetical protein
MYSDYGDSTFFVRPTNVAGDLLEVGNYRYELNTPFRFSGGISYQLGKFGILTGDVEYINYSLMKMRTDEDFNSSQDQLLADDVNADIDNIYRPVVNFRLGAEIRFGEFAVRAGGAYFPSPYAEGQLNEDASHTEITSGLGYRGKHFFFDFGFSGLFHTEFYNLYTSNNTNNIARLKQSSYRFITTMGFRF